MVSKAIDLHKVEDVKRFVEIVTPYEDDVTLCSGRFVVNAKSILGILSLDLEEPVRMDIYGDNAQPLVEQLGSFICGEVKA